MEAAALISSPATLAFDADDSIVVAGAAGGHATILRFDEDGTMDALVGSGTGYVTAAAFDAPYSNLYSVSVDANGRILAGGSLGGQRMLVARYNADGTPDDTFGGGPAGGTGWTSAYISTNRGEADAIGAVSADGMITAVGTSLGAEGGMYNFAIGRFLPDNAVVVRAAAPTEVRAVALSRDDVQLAWAMESGPGPDGFIIQRSTDGGVTYSPVATVDDPDARSFDVTGLDPSTTYKFRVDGVMDDGDGTLGDADDFVTAGPASSDATTTQDAWDEMGYVTPDVTTAGTVAYFGDGADFPAGDYRVLYAGGALNFDATADDSDPRWYAALYDLVGPDDPDGEHGGQPDPGNSEDAHAEPTLAAAEYDATPTVWPFYHGGGRLGMYLNEDTNTQYTSGPGVTWRLQRRVPHVSAAVAGPYDWTTEGDATPAKLWFGRDGNMEDDLDVSFTLGGGARDDLFAAVRLVPDRVNGGDTPEPIDLASGVVTIPAGANGVMVEVYAADDQTPEWTQDLTVRVADADDYVADHFLGSGPDATIRVRDDDLGLSFDDPDPDAGQIIFVNDNDDDENGVLDLDDTTASADPDLVALHLDAPADVKDGALISLTADGSAVHVWDSPNKGGEDHLLIGDGADVYEWIMGEGVTVPETVWVEAVAASVSLKDIGFTLLASDVRAATPPGVPTTNQATTRATAVDVFIAFGNQNVNDAKKTVVVGQEISLSVNNQPLLADSIQWTIPGSKVSSYSPTLEKTTISHAIDQPAALQQNIVTYYWTDSSDAPIEVNLSVTIKNRTANRKAKFTVTRPDVRVQAKTLNIQSPGDIHIGIVADQVNKPNWIKAGWSYVPPAGSPGFAEYGITFEVPNFPAQAFPGQTQWVQLDNQDWTRLQKPDGGWIRQNVTTTGGLLDSSYPYSTGVGPNRGIADSPDIAVGTDAYHALEVFHEFTMYLMYKQDSSSIWVPLRSVNWFIWFKAETPGTMAGWHATFSSHSVDPADEDARVLPEWINNTKAITDPFVAE